MTSSWFKFGKSSFLLLSPMRHHFNAKVVVLFNAWNIYTQFSDACICYQASSCEQISQCSDMKTCAYQSSVVVTEYGPFCVLLNQAICYKNFEQEISVNISIFHYSLVNWSRSTLHTNDLALNSINTTVNYCAGFDKTIPRFAIGPCIDIFVFFLFRNLNTSTISCRNWMRWFLCPPQ